MEAAGYLITGLVLFVALPVLCERVSPLVAIGGLMLLGAAWKLFA